MKHGRFLKILILIFSLTSLLMPDLSVFAQGNENIQDIQNTPKPEKVTFIYIHGAYELEQKEFEDEIKGLHKYFENKKLDDNYIISPEYKSVFWSNLSRKDAAYALYENGLLNINTIHNKSRIKNTTDDDLFLLINPINKWFLIGDDGASAYAVYFRNLLNNYLYDTIWVLTDNSHINRIYDLIQEKINKTDGKFIFVAHSLGGVIAVNFIINRILLDQDNPKFSKTNYENFAGLITSGDVSSIYNASILKNHMNPQDFACNKNNFIKYIIKNNKFWISYNHRNDIFATSLSKDLTCYNDQGTGFIVSKVNKTFMLHKIADFFRFWDYSDTEIEAHEWMFVNPREFSHLVLRTYRKQISLKNHKKDKQL